MTAVELMVLVREYGIACGQFHEYRHKHNAEGAQNAQDHASALYAELRAELYARQQVAS